MFFARKVTVARMTQRSGEPVMMMYDVSKSSLFMREKAPARL